MCLFPRYILNKKYLSYTTKKKTQHPASYCDDFRKLYVPIGCGKCYECKRQKAQSWRVRLYEELKVQKHAYFVTLTFAPKELEKLCNEHNCTESNAIATIAVRRFLERWRKQHKKSVKHWLITELGQTNTERIHLHGILFPEFPINNEYLEKMWKYGKADTGQFCNMQTINYIVKYVTKVDITHKNYEPIILCSAGLGENFVHTYGAKATYRYRKGDSPEYYTLNNGRRVALPIYYRNKLYTEKEREQLWTDRLDKDEIYVNGIRIQNIESQESQNYYYRLLKEQQRWNNNIGYGNTSEEWQKEPYNITFKQLQHKPKICT